MSDTRHTGVSHFDILDAVDEVRAACPSYDWDCVPGQWLTYMLLLALPFSKKVVRPDPRGPVWTRKPRRGQEGALQDAPDPAGVPEFTDAQFGLPGAVGQLFDRTILASDALRPLADAWCRHAKACLLRVGRIVRPLFATASAAAAAEQPSPPSPSAVDEDGHPIGIVALGR